MGSSVSTSHSNSKCGNTTSEHTSPNAVMQQSVTQKVIPTNGTQALPSSYTPQKPLKGILKNKCAVQQKVEKPVKIVELYVLRGNEWSVSRVREVMRTFYLLAERQITQKNFILGRSWLPEKGAQVRQDCEAGVHEAHPRSDFPPLSALLTSPRRLLAKLEWLSYKTPTQPSCKPF